MSLSNEAKLHCCLQDSRPQPPTTVVSRPRGGAVSHINTTKTKISHKVEVLSSTFSNLTLWPTPLKKIPKQDDGLVITRVVSVVVPSADEKNRAEAEKRRERKQLVAAKRGGGEPCLAFHKEVSFSGSDDTRATRRSFTFRKRMGDYRFQRRRFVRRR